MNYCSTESAIRLIQLLRLSKTDRSFDSLSENEQALKLQLYVKEITKHSETVANQAIKSLVESPCRFPNVGELKLALDSEESLGLPEIGRRDELAGRLINLGMLGNLLGAPFEDRKRLESFAANLDDQALKAMIEIYQSFGIIPAAQFAEDNNQMER